MLQDINKYSLKEKLGFTLIELLIAISIFGIISIIAVQGLFDIVSIRAKQQTIEDSSDSFRVVARIVSKAVTEAEIVSVPNNQEIRITNDMECQTMMYDGVGSILYAQVPGPCTPPIPGANDTITHDDFVITNFNVTPVGNSVNVILLEMEGNYKNSLGDHPIKYSTTITKRI